VFLVEVLFALIPVFLLLVVILIYWRYPTTLERIHFGWREIFLLLLGSASTMFFDVPLFFLGDSFLALNIGGALIPIVLAFYLSAANRFPFPRLVAGLALSSVASFFVTEVTGTGVVSYFPNFFLPSLLSALVALLLFQRSPQTVAFSYTIATFGIVIGADLAHIPELFSEPFKGSLGGAGVSDLVFIAGLVSFCMTFPLVEKRRTTRRERQARRREQAVYAAGAIAGTGGTYSSMLFALTGKTPTEAAELKHGQLLKELYRDLSAAFAPPGKRVAAFLIDSAVIVPVFLSLYLVFLFDSYLFVSLFVLLQIAYFTILETLFAGTVGKLICDIEVRTNMNERPGFMTVFARNIFRLLEALLLAYVVSIIVIAVSPLRQRPGDMMARSIVVSTA
jgi:uncharacterized RDD family membrane protein YckC